MITPVKEYLESHPDIETTTVSKAGGDGQGMQSEYNTKASIKPGYEKSIYTQASVLLKFTDTTNNKVIYENKLANSKYNTRIILREFSKETEEYMEKVTNDLDKQIDELTESEINIGDKKVKVHHKVIPSMNDGKSLNAIATRILKKTYPRKTGIATTCCHLCLRHMAHYSKTFFLNQLLLKH